MRRSSRPVCGDGTRPAAIVTAKRSPPAAAGAGGPEAPGAPALQERNVVARRASAARPIWPAAYARCPERRTGRVVVDRPPDSVMKVTCMFNLSRRISITAPRGSRGPKRRLRNQKQRAKARRAPIVERTPMTYLATLNGLNTSRVERTGKPQAIPGTLGQSLGPLVLCVAFTSLAAIGCSGDDEAGEADGGEGSQPAVVIGNRICTADECLMYLGAFPDVPSGELDQAKMIEFSGLAYVSLFEGRVYSYERESGKLTKFIITDDFLLEPAGELSFEAFGPAGSPARSLVASPSRAFTYLRDPLTIVVWNPSTMEVESEIPMP